ncbi:hypothetical protein [Sedimentibacter sp. MB31-C6]|uniref:hypothetical protein n=1 Tax=Sedimentibacter sp. MB31-C6 TaxID=3109366 RepID=UPI002DDCACCF|nr:hypothetical protein [Sedimentibacter sp. MB36-C1]WSI03461.1 hypothetical protein U8307_10415 [Sedimentibacter sp. MB36-C1]
MSRYFMYGTSLGGIEQLMMLAPNFHQRGSGVVTECNMGEIILMMKLNKLDVCLKRQRK